MPVYTYVCDSCGVRFDRHQKFTDPVLTRCPECNKKSLRKVFQPVGIVFKGSGFYSTDNRSPSGASRASGKSESDSGSHSSGDSKNGESKSGESTKSESTASSNPPTATASEKKDAS